MGVTNINYPPLDPGQWSDCRVTPRDNFVCGVQASGSGAQPGKWTIAAAALWRTNWTSDTSLIEYKSQKCPCLSRLYQFACCLLFTPVPTTHIFWLHNSFEVVEGDLAVVAHRALEHLLQPSQVFSGQLISLPENTGLLLFQITRFRKPTMLTRRLGRERQN